MYIPSSMNRFRFLLDCGIQVLSLPSIISCLFRLCQRKTTNNLIPSPSVIEGSQYSISSSPTRLPKRMSRKTRESDFATVWFESSGHHQLGTPPSQPPPGSEFALGDLYLHYLSGNRSTPETWFRSAADDGSHMWLSYISQRATFLDTYE
ncbi:hypothetical protein P692DRAFT_20820555 [Suillus brevipes Sb2]|nr:hypothetical protein P692DRAFT_20820555 [Suillus brevipes Sb2]